MALIELNLEKPALKRTESGKSSVKKSEESSEKSKATEKVGKGTSMVEMPEGENVEEEKSSGGGLLRRIAMLGATAGAVVALRRWRSGRKQQSSRQAQSKEEWETPASE